MSLRSKRPDHKKDDDKHHKKDDDKHHKKDDKYEKKCYVDDCLADKVRDYWIHRGFKDTAVLLYPSVNQGVAVLTHTHGDGHLLHYNGRPSKSPLSNNALYSFECIGYKCKDKVYLNLYEIMIPDFPGEVEKHHKKDDDKHHKKDDDKHHKKDDKHRCKKDDKHRGKKDDKDWTDDERKKKDDKDWKNKDWKKVQPSTSQIYVEELEQGGIVRDGDHYHWKGTSLNLGESAIHAIHHSDSAHPLHPLKFSKITIDALLKTLKVVEKRAKHHKKDDKHDKKDDDSDSDDDHDRNSDKDDHDNDTDDHDRHSDKDDHTDSRDSNGHSKRQCNKCGTRH